MKQMKITHLDNKTNKTHTKGKHVELTQITK